MNGITTKDLGPLENSFDYLEDLPKGNIRCVEMQDDNGGNERFYRDEKNARAKFNELAKKHDLTVRGNWGKNEWGKQLRMGKITFED